MSETPQELVAKIVGGCAIPVTSQMVNYLAVCVIQQQAEIERLREALNRQGDNMAFALNNVTMPSQWYEKLTTELAEDRAALEATP